MSRSVWLSPIPRTISPPSRMSLLAARGMLASKIGYNGAVTDYLVHLFRVRETVDAHYAHDIPADVRRVLEAYADGVNYYAALHPEKVAPGVLPITGKDVDAGFVFRTPFFYGIDKVMKHITTSNDDMGEPPVGSNGVAVAPSRNRRWRNASARQFASALYWPRRLV